MAPPVLVEDDYGFVLSPDGETLAVSDEEQNVQLRDAATSKGRHRIQKEQGENFGWPTVSPDGELLTLDVACKDGRSFRHYDVTTGKERRRIAVRPPVGFFIRPPDEPTAILVFAPDGKVLATAPTHDTLVLWAVATGREPLR